MKLLDASLGLNEIETILDYQLIKRKGNLIICEDLDISYEEYKCLIFRVKGLAKFNNNIEILYSYKLCVLISVIFALKYDFKDRTAFKLMEQFLGELSQHQIRYVLTLLATIYSEYGFEEFDIDPSSINGFYILAAIHGGVPFNSFEEIYQIVELSSINQNILKFEKNVIDSNNFNAVS